MSTSPFFNPDAFMDPFDNFTTEDELSELSLEREQARRTMMFQRASDFDSRYARDFETPVAKVMVFDGRFVTNPTDADFAAMRAAYPDVYNTRNQAENQLVNSWEQDYMAGASRSEYLSLDVREMSRRSLETFLGMPGAGHEILTEEAYKMTLADIGIILPGTNLGEGRDLGYLEGGLTGMEVAMDELRAIDPTVPIGAQWRRLTTEQKVRLGGILDKMGVLNAEMGQVPLAADLMDAQGADLVAALDSKLALAEEETKIRQREVETLDEGRFEAMAAKATDLGLESKTARAFFIIENFHQQFYRDAASVLSGKAPKSLLAERLKQGTHLFGADFVPEAMMGVTEKGFTLTTDAGRKAAWATLPDDYRIAMENLGYTPDSLEDKAHIRNSFSFLYQVQQTLIHRSGQEAREAAFRTGLHDGWANWTRRVTDTVMTDFGHDPVALYFTAPAVVAGVTTGMLVGAGASATAAGTGSVARMMAYTAIDGAFAGVAEGITMSMKEQQNSFFHGITDDIVDYGAVAFDAALYGGLGAAFGSGIAGIIGGAPRFARYIGHQLEEGVHVMDEVRVKHGIGTEESLEAAKNRLAVYNATPEELAKAERFNLINPGAVIRLERGEIDAMDVVRHSLNNMVDGTDPARLKALEAFFDPEALSRMGISVLEAADLVLQLHNRLGPAQTVSGDWLMGVIQRYAKRADRARRYSGVGGKTSAERRVRFAEAALKQNGKALVDNFVGGVYRALSDSEFGALVALARKAATEKLSGAELRKMMVDTLRLNDRRLQKRFGDLIRKQTEGRSARWTGYLDAFEGRVKGLEGQARKIRKDRYFRKVLAVEAAMDMIDTERTIVLAKELGLSYGQLKSYVRELKGAIGDPKLVRDIDLRYSGVREAIEKLHKDGTVNLKFLEGDEAYNVHRFFQEDAGLEDLMALEKTNKQLVKESNAARKAFKDRPEELAAKLKEIRERYAPEIQGLAKKLGMDIDMETAMERVVAKMDGTLPFKAMSALQQGKVLEDGITRAIDNVSSDKIGAGLAARDRTFMDQMFKGTGLGETLERFWSRIAMWGSTATAMTRSDHRIIRGISQLFTGQHVANRVHTNLTSFATIESAVESARRIPITFHLMRRAQRHKLGSNGSHMLGITFNKLRMTGRLSSGVLTEANISAHVPDALLKAYRQVGGAAELIKDLQDMQSEFTSIMMRSLEEARDAGLHIPHDVNPQTYIPHRVAGNISAEKAAAFVADFRALREKQLLNDLDRALDMETLDALGWIRITRGGGTKADGTILNKQFVVPPDSPFYGLSGKTDAAEIQKWVEANIIDKGLKQLESMDPSRAASASRTRKSAVELASQPVDHLKIRQGEEILRTKDTPRYESAASNGRSQTVADAVAGLDEELTTLERARSEIAKMDDKTQRATGTKKLSKQLDVAIANRRRMLNELIRESMDVPDNLPIRSRSRMTPAKRAAVSTDDPTYRALSEGHDKLVNRLDELVAQGIINDQAKRVIMAAFADVDADKIAGMSFTRLDTTMQQRVLGMADVYGDNADAAVVRLSDISNLDIADGHPALAIAETFAHEVSHIAFLSAPPKMQRAFQALFQKVKNGHRNDILKLFTKHGLDPEYATSNVHEFVAHLAQISLVSSRTVADPVQRNFLQKTKDYFVKLMRNLWLGDELNVEDVADWDLIDRGVRAIFNGIEDVEVTDAMAAKYGVAAKVDAFGRSANSIKRGVDADFASMDSYARQLEASKQQLQKLENEKFMNNMMRKELADSGKAMPKDRGPELNAQIMDLKIIIEDIVEQMSNIEQRIVDNFGDPSEEGLAMAMRKFLGTEADIHRAEMIYRADTIRAKHMESLDKLEDDVLEELAYRHQRVRQSKDGVTLSIDEARAELSEISLDDTRLFLQSIDPRVTSGMNILEVLGNPKSAHLKDSAGLYIPTANVAMINRELIENADMKTVGRQLNRTLQHEITHHMTYSLLRNNQDFLRKANKLYSSFATDQERIEFLETLSAISEGLELGEPGAAGIRVNFARDADGKIIGASESRRVRIEGDLGTETRVAPDYLHSEYLVDTPEEFVNDLVRLMIRADMDPSDLKGALRKMGYTKPETIMQRLKEVIADWLDASASFLRFTDSTGGKYNKELLLLQDIKRMATDWEISLQAAGQAEFKLAKTMQDSSNTLYVYRMLEDSQLAPPVLVKALQGHHAQSPEMYTRRLLSGNANLTNEEKIVRINELMRAASKEKGHLHELLKLQAYKLHDEVHGTNKFYTALQEIDMPAVVRDVAPPEGAARRGSMLVELDEKIKAQQEIVVKAGDNATPEMERTLLDLIREKEELLEQINSPAKARSVDEALETTPTKAAPPSIDAPKVTKAQAEEDQAFFMLYMSQLFDQRVADGTLNVEKHSASFHNALIHFMDRIEETGGWGSYVRGVQTGSKEKTAIDIASDYIFGRAADEYKRLNIGAGRELMDIGDQGLRKSVPRLDPVTGEVMRGPDGNIIYDKVGRGNVSIDARATDDGIGLQIADEGTVAPDSSFTLDSWRASVQENVTRLGILGEDSKVIRQYQDHVAMVETLIHHFPDDNPYELLKAARRKKNNAYTAEANKLADRIAEAAGTTRSKVQRATNKGGPMNLDDIKAIEARAAKVTPEQLAESRRVVEEPPAEKVVDEISEDVLEDTATADILTGAAARGEQDKLDAAPDVLKAADEYPSKADVDGFIAAHPEWEALYGRTALTEMFYDANPPQTVGGMFDMMVKLGYPEARRTELLRAMWRADSALEILGGDFMHPQNGSGASFARELAGLYEMVQNYKRNALEISGLPESRAKEAVTGTSQRNPLAPSVEELESRWAEVIEQTARDADVDEEALLARAAARPHERASRALEQHRTGDDFSAHFFRNSAGEPMAAVSKDATVVDPMTGNSYPIMEIHFTQTDAHSAIIDGMDTVSDLPVTNAGNARSLLSSVFEAALEDADRYGYDVIHSYRSSDLKSPELYVKLLRRNEKALNERGWQLTVDPSDPNGFWLTRSSADVDIEEVRSISDTEGMVVKKLNDSAEQLAERIDEVDSIFDLPRSEVSAILTNLRHLRDNVSDPLDMLTEESYGTLVARLRERLALEEDVYLVPDTLAELRETDPYLTTWRKLLDKMDEEYDENEFFKHKALELIDAAEKRVALLSYIPEFEDVTKWQERRGRALLKMLDDDADYTALHEAWRIAEDALTLFENTPKPNNVSARKWAETKAKLVAARDAASDAAVTRTNELYDELDETMPMPRDPDFDIDLGTTPADSPNIAELRDRYAKDAKARAEREGQGLGRQETDRRAFEGMEGPEPTRMIDDTDYLLREEAAIIDAIENDRPHPAIDDLDSISAEEVSRRMIEAMNEVQDMRAALDSDVRYSLVRPEFERDTGHDLITILQRVDDGDKEAAGILQAWRDKNWIKLPEVDGLRDSLRKIREADQAAALRIKLLGKAKSFAEDGPVSAPKPKPDAPAPKAPADAGAGGTPPPPPKAPPSAGGAGGKPPKGPKKLTPKQLAAAEAARSRFAKGLHKHIVKSRLRGAGSFNQTHRLADRDMSLSDLYRAAVKGEDSSLYHPDYVADMRAQGFTGDVAPLEVVGKRYIQHASGGYKAAYRGEKDELTHVIGQVSNPSNHFSRTFNDADLMDEEFGHKIADLLSTSTSPELLLQQYAEMTLGSIRIERMLKDIFQTEGVTVVDLLGAVEQALQRQASTSFFDGTRGHSMGRVQKEEISEYVMKLGEMYLRARGMNPTSADRGAWGRMSRISRNLTYSILGPKFALSVLMVEAPKAIVRASGLNPVLYAKHTGQIVGSLIQGLAGQAMTYKPLQKFMANFGIDHRMLRHSLEDMVYEFEQMQSSAFARHGMTEDETASHELVYNVIERAKRHWSETKGGPETTLLDRIESGTAAMADLTGVLSFMTPVTNAVRNVASNMGKGNLLKHYGNLIIAAERLNRLHEGGRFSTKEAIAVGRELGIPREMMVYVAHSGLLADGGGVLRQLASHLPKDALQPGAAGRLVDMNLLQRNIDNARQGRREAGLGVEYDPELKRLQEADDKVLPALNQYLMYWVNEASPELRGAMRVQGKNPLTDLMFSLVTYPMAAYQSLFGSGVMSKGVAKMGALVFGLSILEYINRNVQRALHTNDPDERAEAVRSLTNPEWTDMIDVVAQYGTSSPIFGQLGPYVKDIAGAPMANMAYDALGVPSEQREKFWKAQPFSSPAISMVQRLVGTPLRVLDAGSKAAFSDDPRKTERFKRAAGDMAKIATEVTPLNNYALDFGVRSLTGGGLADHAKAMFYVNGIGQQVGTIVPAGETTLQATFPTAFPDRPQSLPSAPTSRPQMQLPAPAQKQMVPMVQQDIPKGVAQQDVLGAPRPQSKGIPSSPGEGLADWLDKR